MNLNKFKISKVIENQPGINNKRKSKAKEAHPGIINKTNRLRVKEEVPEINIKENFHNNSKPLNP
jgi:hypothetical protein